MMVILYWRYSVPLSPLDVYFLLFGLLFRVLRSWEFLWIITLLFASYIQFAAVSSYALIARVRILNSCTLTVTNAVIYTHRSYLFLIRQSSILQQIVGGNGESLNNLHYLRMTLYFSSL